MTAYVKVSGTYRTVPETGLYLRQNSSYTGKLVTAGYVKAGGTYRQFYQGANAQTYTFVASYSRSARGTTWATTGNPGGPTYPRQGRYNDNVYPWFGLFTFTNDSSGVSLTSRLATRPVVKSASLTLKRWDTAHGYWPDGYGYLYIGKYNDSIYATSPHPGYVSFSNYAQKAHLSGSDPLSLGEITTINLASQSLANAQALVNHAKTNPLCIANTTNTGTSTGGLQHLGSSEDSSYFIYYPYDAYYLSLPLGPYLTVTLDYV